MNEPKPDPQLFIAPIQYRHYKGGLYQVLHMALDSESLQTLVVYKALKDEGQVWVRSAAMFLEQVLIEGQWVPRFSPVNESP
jgi:hypothetical protein